MSPAVPPDARGPRSVRGVRVNPNQVDSTPWVGEASFGEARHAFVIGKVKPQGGAFVVHDSEASLHGPLDSYLVRRVARLVRSTAQAADYAESGLPTPRSQGGTHVKSS